MDTLPISSQGMATKGSLQVGVGVQQGGTRALVWDRMQSPPLFDLVRSGEGCMGMERDITSKAATIFLGIAIAVTTMLISNGSKP